MGRAELPEGSNTGGYSEYNKYINQCFITSLILVTWGMGLITLEGSMVAGLSASPATGNAGTEFTTCRPAPRCQQQQLLQQLLGLPSAVMEMGAATASWRGMASCKGAWLSGLPADGAISTMPRESNCATPTCTLGPRVERGHRGNRRETQRMWLCVCV